MAAALSAGGGGGAGGIAAATDGASAPAEPQWGVACKVADKELEAQGAGIRCVACSADSILSGSSRPVVKVWQVTEAKVTEARTMKHGAVGSSCVEVSQDNQMAAICADDGSIGFWDFREGNRSFELPASISTAWKAKFLPGGKRLVSGGPSGTLCFWDLSARKLVNELDANGNAPQEAKTDGTKDNQDSIKRRRTEETGRAAAVSSKLDPQETAVAEAARARGPIFSLTVSADGRFLGCGRGNGTIGVLRLPPDGRSEWLGEVGAHWGNKVSPVRALAFDPACRVLLSGGDDHHICLLDAAAWGRRRSSDLARLPQLERFSAHRGWVTSVSVCPDRGRHIAVSTSWDSTVKLWDFRTHAMLFKYKEHTDCVFGSAFAPGGRFFATVGADAHLVLYTATSSALVPRGS